MHIVEEYFLSAATMKVVSSFWEINRFWGKNPQKKIYINQHFFFKNNLVEQSMTFTEVFVALNYYIPQ